MPQGRKTRVLKYLLIKSQRALRQKGPFHFLQKAAFKARKAAFKTNSSIWYEKELGGSQKRRKNPSLPVSVSFRAEEREEVIEWIRERHSEFPWMYFSEEVRSARANGHIYAKITLHGKIIGYAKIGFKSVFIHDFDEEVSFREKDAFLYDIFVLPEYRGFNIATFVHHLSCDFLLSRGYTHVFCHIEDWNKPSIRSIEKSGFRPFRKIRYMRVFNLRFFISKARVSAGIHGFIYGGRGRVPDAHSINGGPQGQAELG